MNDHCLFISDQARLDLVRQDMPRPDQFPPEWPVFMKAAILAGGAARAAALWNERMQHAAYRAIWMLL